MTGSKSSIILKPQALHVFSESVMEITYFCQPAISCLDSRALTFHMAEPLPFLWVLLVGTVST